MDYIFNNIIDDFTNIKNNIFMSPLLKNKGLFNLSIKNYGLKLRAFPNTKQEAIIMQTLKDTCFVQNKTLEYNLFSYKQLGKTLTPKVTDLKNDFPWLALHKTTDSLALANAQQNLRKAWDNFFENKMGFPKFKKSKYFYSYTTNNQHGSIRFEKIDNVDYLKLPKLGCVKINKHREMDGIIKTATVNFENNICTISLCFEQLEFIPKIDTITKDLFLGLDFSCKDFYVDSNGNLANYENYYTKNEKKLAKLQRQLSKKKKGSNNYNKLKARINKLHKKITNERMDFLHKLSTQLVKEYKYICVEDINLRGLSQTLKLGKSIMSKGFGMFREFLKYKLDKVGGLLIVIDKWFASSKTCNCCGYKKTDLKLSERSWLCPICNTKHNRDNNAAKNIRDEGYRVFLAELI